MGCDIHMHIEVKLDGAWQHYGAPRVNRNYDLFEKLAGVRGDAENAIALPKGLPADATLVTLRDYEGWEGDAHSATWLEESEIEQLEEWLKTQPGRFGSLDLEHEVLNTYLFGSSFTGHKRYPEDNRQRVEDVRFVFWFDN